MRKPPRCRVLTLLVAAAAVVLVAVAVFTGGTSASEDGGRFPAGRRHIPDDAGESGPMSSGRTGALAARIPMLLKSYGCPQCGSRMGWGSEACPRCGWSPARLMHPAALPAARTGDRAGPPLLESPAPDAAGKGIGGSMPAAALPSPREQNAAGKEFIEGHWLGLEAIPLAPELAKEYGVPKGETGVLVDEVTLEAAESGILAGDVVRSVSGFPTPDLKAFFLATQRVREQRQARIGISRRGGRMTFVIEARNTKEMGFAQMEAAQPILPGSISPHRSRGRPCTDCHIIMRTGGQLPTDAGDILPSPPPITKKAKAPHRDRGLCSVCHAIKLW